MTVALPIHEWPSELLQIGPEQDRSIMLRAPVVIGSARFMLTAVRVVPIRLGPDYRSDIPHHVYDDHELTPMLELILELLDLSEPSILQLETGRFVMWMTPSARVRCISRSVGDAGGNCLSISREIRRMAMIRPRRSGQ